MRIVPEAVNRSVEYLHGRILLEAAEQSVIDLGAGEAKYLPLLQASARTLTLVEAFEPYLPYIRVHAPNAVVVSAPALSFLQQLTRGPGPHGQADVVMGIDFIEHLPLEDAKEVIRLAKEVADNIVLFMPEGHHPQDRAADGHDNPLQEHRSEWRPEMLEDLGFEVERWEHFHAWREGLVDDNALWAVWRRRLDLA